MNTRTLLIIDDDANLRELLSGLLTDLGYDVRTAGGGDEGLAIVEEDAPDLVLLDVQMEGMNGPATARRMRHGDGGTPILLVSAHPELPHLAAQLGTPYFVEKPFRLDALLATIEAALGRDDQAPRAGRG